MKVRLIVEGGGNSREEGARLRMSLAGFISRALTCDRRPSIVLKGGREQVFDTFRTYVRNPDDDLPMLLVDSEGEVRDDIGTWAYLKEHSKWDRPEGASDDQAHLMVQAMEAWFVADPEAVKNGLGKNASVTHIRAPRNVESVPKATLESELNKAAAGTSKVRYQKLRDDLAILSVLDPAKVRAASKHARAFFDALQARLEQAS